MKVREHEVDCDWCGAKAGEPCKDLNDKPYTNGMVHRDRRRTYDQIQKLINNRPTNLLPPKYRSTGKGCTR